MIHITHTIELDELQKFCESEEITFASSSYEGKKFKISMRGTFIVYVGNEIVLEGIRPYPAIEAYNSITKKYITKPIDFKL